MSNRSAVSSTVDDVVVLGVASSGSVEQWDGHTAPTGILLRWFARQELGYPDLGWQIQRATVPDIPPLPFVRIPDDREHAFRAIVSADSGDGEQSFRAS